MQVTLRHRLQCSSCFQQPIESLLSRGNYPQLVFHVYDVLPGCRAVDKIPFAYYVHSKRTCEVHAILPKANIAYMGPSNQLSSSHLSVEFTFIVHKHLLKQVGNHQLQ